MFKNYLKVAFRNFWKNKTSFAINIFGLTVGLTSCLLIALYIKHEISYDNFEQKGSRIARVIMEYSFDGSPEANKGNYTSVRVAPVFKRTFPEVECANRMTMRERVVNYQDKFIDKKDSCSLILLFSISSHLSCYRAMCTALYQGHTK
jgi:putative ABC transport system permease protein